MQRINITKRFLPLTNEAARLSVVHTRRFRPTCEVETWIFDPRTTFCRPGISNSPLIFFLRDWQYYYSSTAMSEGKPQPGILKIKCAFWHHRASSACLHLTTIPPPEFLAEEFEEHLTFRVAVKPIFPDTVHKSCVCHRPVICRNSATGSSSYIFNMPKKLKSVTFFHDIFRFFLCIYSMLFFWKDTEILPSFLKQTPKSRSPWKHFQGLLFSL